MEKHEPCVTEHDPDGYEDLKGMVGVRPNPDGTRTMVMQKENYGMNQADCADYFARFLD